MYIINYSLNYLKQKLYVYVQKRTMYSYNCGADKKFIKQL